MHGRMERMKRAWARAIEGRGGQQVAHQVSRPRRNGSHRAWSGPDACVPNHVFIPLTPKLSKGGQQRHEGAYADANHVSAAT